MAAAVTTDTPESTGTWLAFELAGQRYAVPLAKVREVIRAEEPTPVPGAPSGVLGIVNLRGTIVTVYDGCRRLGLASKSTTPMDSERIVIFEFGEEIVGVRVDAMGDVLDLAEAEVMPPPPGRAVRADDPVEGVVPFGEGFVALLDVPQLCRMKDS